MRALLRCCTFRCMAHRLDPVAIGIKQEGSEILRMVLRPHAGFAVAPAARNKPCSMERLYGFTIWRSKTHMHPRRQKRLAALDCDGELDSQGAGHRTIV